MKISVPLTQGKFAIIDSEDFERVSTLKWHASKRKHTYYAVAYVKGTGRKNRKLIYMHRFILNSPAGKQIDHSNGDGLLNTKDNIRICNVNQNRWNMRKTRGTSKFKGVCWDKLQMKWVAFIRHIDKHLYLGTFDSEVLAAKAYDDKAKEFFGEFAKTNL